MKKFKNLVSCLKADQGFTLVELGIVFLIAGLIFAPVYTLLFHVTNLGDDEERFEIVQEALAEHLRVTGTLPCPADASLDMDGNVAAFEAGNCTAVPGGVFISDVAPDDVAVGALPIANLRAAVGCYDANGFVLPGATPDIISAVKEQIYSVREVIGGDKTALTTDVDGDGFLDADYDGDGILDAGTQRVEDTKCLNWDTMLDEYGSKFVYAVTVSATQRGFDVFSPAVGKIYIRDAVGNILHDPTAVPPTGQIYTLISLGPDQKGAFLRDGSRAATGCGTTAGDDNENCDNAIAGGGVLPFPIVPIGGIPPGSLFASALYNDSIGLTHFDDHVEYGIAGFLTEDTFWRWGADTNAGGGRDMVLNDNARLVIDRPSSNNAAFTATANDAIVVNQGQMIVQQDANGIGGRIEIEGAGELQTRSGNITVGRKANSGQRVQSGQYCYANPLTSGCGGP